MKRNHLVSKILLVLVITCMCGCMFALAACNRDNDDNNTTDYSVESSEMLAEVWNNISSGISAGERFGIDIAADFAMKEKDAQSGATYKLIVKGNVDSSAQAAADSTDFNISIVKEDGATRTVLFGFAYEVIEGQPYFYFNVLDGGYQKINGYSLLALVGILGDAVSGVAGDAVGGILGGLDDLESSVISLISSILFNETGTVKDNVYTFDFNLSNTLKKLKSYISMIGDETVNTVIATLFGNLTYTDATGNSVNVTDYDSLVAYVRATMNFTGTVAFKFDANDKFDKVEAAFKYAPKADGTETDYFINLTKLNIGSVSTPINTFDGLIVKGYDAQGVETTNRAQIVAKNLLNFSLNGRAEGRTAGGTAKNFYDINVESDLNPMNLLSLVGSDFSKAENAVANKAKLISALKDLGYFKLTIDEKTANGTHKSNILTLLINFDGTDQGRAILNFQGYSIIIFGTGFGGVYDLNSLADVILSMTIKDTADPGTTDPGTTDDPAEEEGGIDIMSLLSSLLGCFNAENMAQNGVTVDMETLGVTLCTALGLDPTEVITMGVTYRDAIAGYLLNADNSRYMNIALQSPTFGTCDKSFGYTDVEEGARAGTDFAYKGFISEITGIAGLPEVIDTGVDLKSLLLDSTGYFSVIGKDFAGNEVTVDKCFIMGEQVEVIDGVMHVKYTVGTLGSVVGLLSMMEMSPTGLPIFGALSAEAEIPVREYDENAVVVVTAQKSFGAGENAVKTDFAAISGLASGNTAVYKTFSANGNKAIYFKISIDGTEIVYNLGKNDMKVVRVSDGKDVTAEVYDSVSDSITKAGKYYLQFNVGQYVYRTNVDVDSVEMILAEGGVEQTTVEMNGGVIYSYVIKETLSDGTVNILTPTKAALKGLVDADVTLGEDGNYTIITKELSKVGVDAYIAYTVTTTNNGSKTVETPKVKVVNSVSFAWNEAGSIIQTSESVNAKFSITVNGVVYYSKYDVAKGNVVLADNAGNEYSDEYSLDWNWNAGDKEALSFNAIGQITNIPYATSATASSFASTLKIAIGGYTYTNTYLKVNTAYIATTAKTMDAGEQFSEGDMFGTAGAALKATEVAYYVDGARVALEFKYGKDGYGFYVSGTDTLAYAVTVTVTDGEGAPVALENGAINTPGSYGMKISVAFADGHEMVFTIKGLTIKAL